ncbi:CYTH domain-containing protein [Psychrobacillus antarcticus]|uniref:CYTH domain-containing protein n=1 Tax=Psychrobacillus antarcticus TaxID=2879115 RepID=UPI002407C444|nr:CYTH domain-containing protein [Psychrobacillus antarcticus]
MQKEKEIEFKNLLTKEEFEHFVSFFAISQKDFHSQTNYYFDTPDNFFKNNGMGFRLRVLNDHNELTLKHPIEEHVMEENTIHVSNQERDAIINQTSFPSIPFLAQFNLISPLICIGSLQTNRVQIPFENGTLFFDHSIYSKTEDFEVEYESSNVKYGKEVFLDLLDSHQIPIRHTDKKIARLVKYNAKLKG